MDNTRLSMIETEKIAKLAKINLSEKEIEVLNGQLSEILDFVKKISTLDTKNVAPLSNVVEQKNVFREDEVNPSLSQNEALTNAPRKFNGYFVVDAVFEE